MTSKVMNFARKQIPSGIWRDDQTGIGLLATGIVAAMVQSGEYPIWRMWPAWIDVWNSDPTIPPVCFNIIQRRIETDWERISQRMKGYFMEEIRNARDKRIRSTVGHFRGGVLMTMIPMKSGYRVNMEITHSDQSREARFVELRINGAWRLEHIEAPTGGAR